MTTKNASPSINANLGMLAWLLLVLLLARPALALDRQTLNTHIAQVTSLLPRVGRLPETNRLQLALGLPLRNHGGLTNLLHDLYHPGAANFHHYLTPAQFAEQFGPTEQDYQKVLDFARSNQLEVVATYGNRALVDVSGNVADIEKVFQVHMGIYRHPTEARTFYAPDVEPSIDAGLPISYVSGLNNFVIPRPRSHQKTSTFTSYDFNGTGNNGDYIGQDFRTAYVPGVSLTGSGQVVGLFELDGYYSSDITKYASLAGMSSVPQLQNYLCPGVSGAAGINNGEVALDIEMVISLAPGLDKVLVVEGTNEVDVMNAFASPPNGVPVANQISSSWGLGEATDIEPQLMELAAQGQSYFLASGDSLTPANGVQSFAANDNYCTMVGGTELSMTNSALGWQSETVWHTSTNEGSTGYVETDLAIPDYQLGINATANGGSSVHRNVPDVAMCADAIEIVDDNGGFGTSQGTSAAAPLWAAFTALVNERAASESHPPVGFLNPSLYSIAQGPLYSVCFHDVIVGNNSNPQSPNLYQAGPGYDNCTGLGSPNGSNMINVLAGLSGPIFVNFNYTGSLSSQNGSYYTPYKTLTQGVNAASNFGTIIIENAGSSSETPTIVKPLNIIASDGPATFGN
jgi:subtilase family serine protease